MDMVKAEPAKLTRSERAAIRKLVTGMCANYDRNTAACRLIAPATC
jgi:hypothetical protein